MRKSKVLIQERLIKTFAVIGIISFCVLVILQVENMLVSFILAFVINYLLAPFVNAFERAGNSRILGACIIFFSISIIIALITYLLMPHLTAQVNNLKIEIPKYINGITRIITELENHLNSTLTNVYTFNISESADRKMVAFSDQLFSDLPNIISSSITVFILAPFFAFFMLIDGQKIIKKLLALVPNNFFELSLYLQNQINTQIGSFVRARLLEAGFVGVLIFIGLLIIGFPYAGFLALFAGLTNLIPYLGPVIGTIPAVLIALVNGASGIDLLIVIGIFAFAQLIDALFIVPIVVAKIVNLHAVIVVVVIIIGAQIGGILGMIISIPVASVIKLTTFAIYDHFIDFRELS